MQHRINQPSVISESIDGEVVVIALGSGTYYSLRSTAAHIWDALAAGLTLGEVATELGEANPGVTDVRSLVEDFVAQLVDEGLLVPGAPPEPTAEHPVPAADGAWQPPVLETFTDMQDLILLDPVHEVQPEQGWPVSLDPDPS
ncbi:MAG: PqqD family protein [Acidimicrobiales bacterium]